MKSQAAKEAVKIRRAANLITASRFIFAGLLLFSEPLSAFFWTWYLLGGITDFIDGPVARKLHQESEAGAKLDSAADFFFLFCIGVAILRSFFFPLWALVCALVVAFVRLAAYFTGYIRYRTFAALHTLMNKAAGLVLFMFPVLLMLLGMNAACGIVIGAAFLSAVEEFVIMISSRELNRNRKSLWTKHNHIISDAKTKDAERDAGKKHPS